MKRFLIITLCLMLCLSVMCSCSIPFMGMDTAEDIEWEEAEDIEWEEDDYTEEETQGTKTNNNSNSNAKESTKSHTHSYSSATCTSPAKCSCGATQGKALGHDYNGKTCTRCGAKNPNYVAYSRLSGEITYKYNNFVGTRGDSGATIMLIPKKNTVKKYDNGKAALLLSGTYSSGIIVLKTDGYGRFDSGDGKIPVGTYLILIVSHATTDGSRFSDESSWKQDINSKFGNYFSTKDLENLYLGIGYQKFVTDTLELTEEYTQTINYDFGITYI